MGNLPSPKKTTRISESKLARYAVWIIERWDVRPSLSPAQVKVEMRRVFQCGQTAADQAMKRVNEMYRERAAEMFSQDRIAWNLRRLAENAERKGDDRGAAKIYEAIGRVTGTSAPDRVEDVTDHEKHPSELSSAQLEALAALEE